MSDENDIRKLREAIIEIKKLRDRNFHIMFYMFIIYMVSSILYIREVVNHIYFSYFLFSLMFFMGVLFINSLLAKFYVIRNKNSVALYEIIDYGSSLTFKGAKKLKEINKDIKGIEKIKTKINIDEITGKEDLENFKTIINKN